MTTSPGTSRGTSAPRSWTEQVRSGVRGRWEDSPDWDGWWGDEPPFHTPVFVLTHHPRSLLSLSDTTFHFIDATPTQALEQAKAAADGKDVRLGGGVTAIRSFLDADLVDTMHVAVAPVSGSATGSASGSRPRR